MVLAEWHVGQVFWTMIWFTLFFIWVWLVIAVFGDIFRSHELSGLGKALWCLFIIVFPYLGVFVYLVARGPRMTEHAIADAQAREAATRAYIRDAAGTSASPADQLERLAALRSQGVIDDAEFQTLKAKALA
ncbi:MAG: SHOCT domain-containing protein [Acidimicrobiia bacterium]|nr:SHOCT domain-containing protein [Acidimicrobiia bacterium]